MRDIAHTEDQIDHHSTMSHLLQLPAEILLQIYSSLADIDDALRLGRSCRRTHAVLNPVAHCLSIFRTVIVRPLFRVIHRFISDEATSAVQPIISMINDSPNFWIPRTTLRSNALSWAPYQAQKVSLYLAQATQIPKFLPSLKNPRITKSGR